MSTFVKVFGRFWLHVLADTVALTRIYSTSPCLQSLLRYFEGLPTSQVVWGRAALGFLLEADFTQTGMVLFVPSEIKKSFFPRRKRVRWVKLQRFSHGLTDDRRWGKKSSTSFHAWRLNPITHGIRRCFLPCAALLCLLANTYFTCHRKHLPK